jgi:hypothetical protein
MEGPMTDQVQEVAAAPANAVPSDDIRAMTVGELIDLFQRQDYDDATWDKARKVLLTILKSAWDYYEGVDPMAYHYAIEVACWAFDDGLNEKDLVEIIGWLARKVYWEFEMDPETLQRMKSIAVASGVGVMEDLEDEPADQPTATEAE